MCECKRGPRQGRKMAATTRESNTRPGKPAGKEPQPLVIAKTAAEEQRLKLERLMRNPDKPVPIPERPKEWNPRAPPEFVRDVMGSSAGAGSGEFHVYRHLRRREYQRQECMDTMSEKQKLDKEYQEKLQKNNQATAEKTAKRRKKRQKIKEKKLMAQKAKLQEGKDGDGDSGSNSASSSDMVPRKEGDDDAEEPSFVMGEVTGDAEEPCFVMGGDSDAEEPSFVMGGDNDAEEPCFVMGAGDSDAEEPSFVMGGDSDAEELSFVMGGDSDAEELSFVMGGDSDAEEPSFVMGGDSDAEELSFVMGVTLDMFLITTQPARAA